jgi:hypothetical protein
MSVSRVSQNSANLINAGEIGAVIFDMDGLMLDTEPLYKAAWQAASAQLGYPIDDPFYARLVGRPTEDCERELVGQFGPVFALDRFRARWPELWQAEVAAKGIQQKPGLLTVDRHVASDVDGRHGSIGARVPGERKGRCTFSITEFDVFLLWGLIALAAV